MTYDKLLVEADLEGVAVKEKDLIMADGLTIGNNIAIKRDISTAEKACVLAEELGHYHTTVGNIISQDTVANRKQERKARLWAYDHQIGLSGIISGYRARCQSQYELAEYLGVTEYFLQDAISCYRAKYGVMAEIDNCHIFFEPTLAVIEKYN